MRNMRFDNVVLQSRDEDMRRLLLELEDELRSLEKMLDDCNELSDKREGKEGQEQFNHSSPARLNYFPDWGDKSKQSSSRNNVPEHIKKDMVNKNIDFGDDSSRDGTDSVDLSTITGTTNTPNKLSQLQRIFQWGKQESSDRQRLRSSLGSTASESYSTATAPMASRRNDRQSQLSKKQADEESISSHAMSVNSAPLFQWFGDHKRSRRRRSEMDMHNGNLFNRMFQRNSFNSANGTGFSKTDEIIGEKSSIFQENSAIHEAELLSSLDLKLRGCDLAKSSLQELHTLKSRTLLDLERDHIHTQIENDVQSNAIDDQLREIRDKYAYCQKENKRRQRLLKEAIVKAKKANNREELLLGEIECVRTELFTINQMLELD